MIHFINGNSLLNNAVSLVPVESCFYIKKVPSISLGENLLLTLPPEGKLLVQ